MGMRSALLSVETTLHHLRCPTRVSTLPQKSALQEGPRRVGERAKDRERERDCFWCCQHDGLLYFSGMFGSQDQGGKRREEKRRETDLEYI